jgi:hypothetical protein
MQREVPSHEDTNTYLRVPPKRVYSVPPSPQYQIRPLLESRECDLLPDGRPWVRFPADARHFMLSITPRQTRGPTQTTTECVPRFLPAGKAAKAWIWPLTHLAPTFTITGAILFCFPSKPSRRGQGQLYLYLSPLGSPFTIRSWTFGMRLGVKLQLQAGETEGDRT